MRLDHISYAASHDQLVDIVQSIGSRLEAEFIDGGIHPRFGTRNFILPLKNNQYVEIVCPLEHPASDLSPFRKAVMQKVNQGGGWFTWVFSTENIKSIEKELGRNAVEGHRKRPDGSELKWKQIGVIDTLSNPQLPYFIEWESGIHPSSDAQPKVAIKEITVCGTEKEVDQVLSGSAKEICNGVVLNWIEGIEIESEKGISSVVFSTSNRDVEII